MPGSAIRLLAGLAASLIVFSTVSQGWLSVQDMLRGGGTQLEGVWRYLGYFTVLTNSFVAIVLARAAFAPAARSGLNAPRVELMAVTSILFVGVVYNVLLASLWNPQGLQKFNDVVLHTIAPVLFSTFWLLRPRGELGWRDAAFAASWPVAYSAYGLTRGALDGFYPYFFMDPTRLALPQLIANMALLVMAFMAGALLLVAIDRSVARLVRQPQK